MSEEKKASRETRCGPFQDPAFKKKFQALFDEGDDCAQMMSRIRAICCGPPERPEERDESVKEKKA